MKTALAIFSTLLISGMAVQTAAASEHHGRNTQLAQGYHQSVLRKAYNQVIAPTDVVAPRTLDRFDPSSSREDDPSLNPPGS